MKLSLERLFSKDSIASLVALTALAAGILWLDFAEDPFREAATRALIADPEVIARFGEVRDVSLRKKTTFFADTDTGLEDGEELISYVFHVEGSRGEGRATAMVRISSEDAVELIEFELDADTGDAETDSR